MKKQTNDSQRAAVERYRHGLYDRGLCVRCREPKGEAEAQKWLCAACAARNRDNAVLRIAWLKSQGVCVECGANPARPDRMTCAACALKRKIQVLHRQKAADQKNDGQGENK